MERLLEHHIADTKERFSELKEDLRDLAQKVDALGEFKTSVLSHSRWIAALTSAVVGAGGAAISMLVNYLLSHK